MSWTKSSEGKLSYANSGSQATFDVLSEIVTSYKDRAVYSSAFSIPAGRDFSVVLNSAGTNLSDSAHVELFVSNDNSVYKRWNKAGFNATTAAIDNATKNLVYDVSTHGQWAYYKFKITDGGGSVKFEVVTNGAQDFVQ